MRLDEALLCTVVPPQGLGALSLHDIQTGAPLASFKQTSSGSRCTAVLPSRNGVGGTLLAAQRDKAVLNVYSFQKVCWFDGSIGIVEREGR
jgi:pre-rRNA-processing protein IPI3